jgi:hypothetical protein
MRITEMTRRLVAPMTLPLRMLEMDRPMEPMTLRMLEMDRLMEPMTLRMLEMVTLMEPMTFRMLEMGRLMEPIIRVVLQTADTIKIVPQMERNSARFVNTTISKRRQLMYVQVVMKCTSAKNAVTPIARSRFQNTTRSSQFVRESQTR